MKLSIAGDIPLLIANLAAGFVTFAFPATGGIGVNHSFNGPEFQ